MEENDYDNDGGRDLVTSDGLGGAFTQQTNRAYIEDIPKHGLQLTVF